MSTGGSPRWSYHLHRCMELDHAYFGMKFLYFKGYELGGKAVDFLVGPQAEAIREAVTMLGGIGYRCCSSNMGISKQHHSIDVPQLQRKEPFLDLTENS